MELALVVAIVVALVLVDVILKRPSRSAAASLPRTFVVDLRDRDGRWP